jgi:D-lactate dehydrogenase (cytochrome)
MRENILGVQCVLACEPEHGAVVANCGTNALKSSAGYDLTSLMTGSEGTLGVITHVTVKLHPIPSYVTAAVCCFDDLHSAAEAVTTIRQYGIPLERCELLDTTSVQAFQQYQKTGTIKHQPEHEQRDAKPTLFLEFTGASEVAVQEQVKAAEAICSDDYGGSHFKFTSNEEERRELWKARHQLYYATLGLRKGTTGALLTDACVPLSKFADLIAATAEHVRELNVVGPCFGHAGDGNFHCILPLVDHEDSEDYLQRVHSVNETLIQRTLAAGGTCTGEHGVGSGKIKYLTQQYGPGAVQMMRRIKQSLDPLNILNPGKVVPAIIM